MLAQKIVLKNDELAAVQSNSSFRRNPLTSFAAASDCPIRSSPRSDSRERNGLVELPQPRGLAPGTRVRVISGPLHEQIGLLAALRPHERVLVLLQLLGGERPVESRAGRDRGGLTKDRRTKRKGYDFVRVGVERKTSARDRRVAESRGQLRRRQQRPQEEQAWWMRPRRPGG
jgi:hypothetical protein